MTWFSAPTGLGSSRNMIIQNCETRAVLVGAENRVTLCDLRVFVDQSAEPIASYDLDQVVRCRRWFLGVGWSLLERPVRPVPVTQPP